MVVAKEDDGTVLPLVEIVLIYRVVERVLEPEYNILILVLLMLLVAA
jgi:hypothetical protein